MIVIKYPPDFDGELHIKTEHRDEAITFSFTHARIGTEWQTLVKVATDILTQNDRMISKGK